MFGECVKGFLGILVTVFIGCPNWVERNQKPFVVSLYWSLYWGLYLSNPPTNLMVMVPIWLYPSLPTHHQSLEALYLSNLLTIPHNPQSQPSRLTTVAEKSLPSKLVTKATQSVLDELYRSSGNYALWPQGYFSAYKSFLGPPWGSFIPVGARISLCNAMKELVPFL